MHQFVRAALVPALIVVMSCGEPSFAQDFYGPSAVQYDASRLSGYSDKELIDLLSAASEDLDASNPGGTYTDYVPAVEKEILRRRPIAQLLDVFARSYDFAQPRFIIEIFALMNDPQVDVQLRKFITNDPRDTASFLAARYFAQRCDLTALGILNQNYGKYPISSVDRATIADAFGDCRYLPAIPNLVASVNAASLNLMGSAQNSLSKIYPQADIQPSDPPEHQKAWEKYVRLHPLK